MKQDAKQMDRRIPTGAGERFHASTNDVLRYGTSPQVTRLHLSDDLKSASTEHLELTSQSPEAVPIFPKSSPILVTSAASN